MTQLVREPPRRDRRPAAPGDLGTQSPQRPAAIVAVGLVIMLICASNDHEWLAFYFAISIGVAVGTFSGTLVTRLGIPSFVVTLALLLAWEGVELYALKNQSVGTTNFDSRSFAQNEENNVGFCDRELAAKAVAPVSSTDETPVLAASWQD